MEDRIKSIFLKFGADVCGIANVDRFAQAPQGFHPTDVYKECKSVVVFALGLPKGLNAVSPRIVYHRFNSMSLKQLDSIAMDAAKWIESLGGTAVPLPCDGPYDYWNSEAMEGRGIISMRHAAYLAGIGCMGKNTLIMNKRFGSMLNIGAVLTNLDLKSDPLHEELCIKNCRICLDACPQKALNGVTVNQKLCRQHTYSTNARGFEVCECNRCRVMCPWSAGARVGEYQAEK